MKFIDELDVERVNQTLNFELTDCKIIGGCDIFTTKSVASDKKLYKTIDKNLDVLIQDNEQYDALMRQRQGNNENVHAELQVPSDPSNKNSKDMNSFWEQKRRMSVTENENKAVVSVTPMIGPQSNKLNNQNLKELVLDHEYLSSSSADSSLTQSSSDSRRKRLGSFNVTEIKSSNVEDSGFNTTANEIKMQLSANGDNILNDNSNNKFKVNKNSTTRRRSSINNDMKSNITIGPFGPINETASRRTFAYLIAILNASYPDHDFSSLEPTDFVKSNLKSLISKFENSLYSLGKKPEEWMWEIINSHMDLNECVIYRYDPNKSFLDDEPGHLWSLNWFLFNKKRKRVAYMYLYALRVQNPLTEINSELKDTIARRKLTIDHESNQFEGEYDFAHDESNDYAVEDESDIDTALT